MAETVKKGKRLGFFVVLWTVFWALCLTVYGGSPLSEEEEAYVRQKKRLRVAVNGGWRPISYQDGKDGKTVWRGLACDILNRLGEETGLAVEYVEAADYMEAVRMTVEGETDLAAGIVCYPGSENVFPIRLSEPYLTAQMMLLHRKDIALGKLDSYTEAEVRGYQEFTDNPDITHMQFATPGECLQAVRSGYASMMYCDVFTGSVYMQQYANRDLVSFPINTETEFRFGIAEEDGDLLSGLLNRVMDGFTRNDVNKSLTRNRLETGYSLGDYVYHYPFEIVCISLTAAMLLVLVCATYYRIKSNQSIASQEYMDSYRLLADNLGEAGFDYDYQKDTMKVFGKYAHKLAMPERIENFTSYLERTDREISLSREEFERLLEDGMAGNSFEKELRCRVKPDGWRHFKLIFSVLSTNESYQRPIRMLGCLNDVEASYLEKEKLRLLGMNDVLTGLLNRAGLDWKLREREKRGFLPGQDLLVLMDVDSFKNFNDQYGHQCGDDVLIQTGRLLREQFRLEDILCRWGGDEFLLYLVGAAGHTERIAKKFAVIQETMADYQYEGRKIPVTYSIGGTVVGDGTFEEDFKAADQSLYLVKERGRNGVELPTERS